VTLDEVDAELPPPLLEHAAIDKTMSANSIRIYHLIRLIG
jgi:hypothetical protein